MTRQEPLTTITTDDFLRFAKLTDEEAARGETIPASVVLAELRAKHRAST